MIKRTNRLGLSRHIKRAYDKGLDWRGQMFRVKAFRTGGKFPLRLAVVISKKFAPHAVTRNLIRRRIKGAFKPYLKEFAGYDIVVSPSGKAEKGEFQIITEDVQECLEYLQSK